MQNQLIELTELWQRVLGELPPPAQFAVWMELHEFETVKHGIVKAGLKNLQLKGTMTLDHRVRFAAKVMQTKTNDPQRAASLAKAATGER